MTNEPRQINSISRRTVLKASAAGAGTVALSGTATANGYGITSDTDRDEACGEIVTQTVDVMGQGPDRELVAEGSATLHRTADALVAELTMPTPEPGEYTYASEPPEQEGEWFTTEPGELEAFTLWMITFNNPEQCEAGVGECGAPDLESAGGGAFGVNGAVPAGDQLTLSGFVTTETEVFENGDPLGVPLERPMEAEVHVAVAPHGAFDPAMMPAILETPVSPPDVWWVAIFEPPA
ncbi:twin-arginine translocation signal domain-containing protein [Halobacteria archaeon AArc-curdl1]|uniref:Twin-arginine translocation signal domain-containing protein n=1 Tax=Natronosalvus hydrolyticus TaxID=2979988 RepID=A0AAP2Z8A7_9EURY|nr:twin-arginine translocation signal domain-containing protein [Halobacteria archaeon AArc-curdl1]